MSIDPPPLFVKSRVFLIPHRGLAATRTRDELFAHQVGNLLEVPIYPTRTWRARQETERGRKFMIQESQQLEDTVKSESGYGRSENFGQEVVDCLD